MKTRNKATILGVGTELTTGQIVNKNGSWISEKLIPYGIETSAHIVVPDHRELILKSLDYAASQSDFIFVTGGLGPTSDDFTRDLISQWAGKELVFDEASWGHVQVRLTSRGFTVKDIQRQQCYFPSGAKILTNSQGTANGFQLTVESAHGPKEVFVLPGPPREIEAIWNDSIVKWLFVQTQLFDKKVTQSWDTLGVGESDVAVLVEKCFENKWPDLQYDLGYRVHLPYVEVKFSYMKSQENLAKAITEKINTALKDITILRHFQDIAQIFSDLVCKTDFAFYDFVSGGYLHGRMSSHLKKYKNWMWKESAIAMDADFFTEEENYLAVLPHPDNELKSIIMFNFNKTNKSVEIEAPMSSPLMSERRKQYFAEMALIQFVKNTSK